MRIGFLKGLLHGLAWSLATAAAVVLSWWGVHTVMAGTAYDPPRAVPITGGTPRSETPVTSSTQRSEPTAPAAPRPTTPPTPPVSPPGGPPKAKPSRSRPAPPPPAPDANEVEDGVIRGYDTKGGRVVLDIGKTEASLVSATPRSGWSMKVSKSSHEIRVLFTTDGAGVSFVCAWDDGQQPQVQITDV